jgi:hypothetical protein
MQPIPTTLAPFFQEYDLTTLNPQKDAHTMSAPCNLEIVSNYVGFLAFIHKNKLQTGLGILVKTNFHNHIVPFGKLFWI